MDVFHVPKSTYYGRAFDLYWPEMTPRRARFVRSTMREMARQAEPLRRRRAMRQAYGQRRGHR